MGLIKTISKRMSDRTAEGKKLTSSDMKYIHVAEDNLFGELAVSLDMTKENVKDYVKDHTNASMSN